MTFVRWLSSLFAVFAFLAAGCGDGNTGPGSAGTIRTLSNRADLISGGDALVEIIPAAGLEASSLRIELNGNDVTPAFSTGKDGRFLGLVGGLAEGKNTLTARTAQGRASTLALTNHANGSPILYGPQVTPWNCDAGATDTRCNRPATYSLLYKSTDPNQVALLAYDASNPPPDVALTTTDAGQTVPFIVRLETGVINRDYYNIAVLFDRSRPWTARDPQSGWNRKVLFAHGSGAGMGFGQYGAITGANVLSVYALSKGYAVMSTALNDNGHNVNVAVQAESMMMLKEHFIESYGEIRYAIGTGSSGGSIAQQWVANAYPGLYDGLVVGASFPDTGTAAIEIEDCGLMSQYFSDPAKWASGISWSDAQRNAAQGAAGDMCTDWAHTPRDLGLDVPYGYSQIFDPSHHGLVFYQVPGLVSPTGFGGCDAPEQSTYQAGSHPTGVRCTVQDYMVGIMGRRPSDGFANRPYANVGVQYGLHALQTGAISPAQFVDLNANIGSHGIDFGFQPGRVAADPPAVDAAYRSGWINSANGLGQVAIIDLRSPDTAGIHHQFRSWAMRARLDAAQGHHQNHVIWFNTQRTMDQALDAMNAWLDAVYRDTGSRPLPQKIVANRPSDLLDQCASADGTGLTMAQCTGTADASPRMAAGGPLRDDVLDCQLMPLARSTYQVAFTDSEWARLQATFPSGVCDYASAGQAQQPALNWPAYLGADGAVQYGGAALPAAPVSTP